MARDDASELDLLLARIRLGNHRKECEKQTRDDWTDEHAVKSDHVQGSESRDEADQRMEACSTFKHVGPNDVIREPNDEHRH